MNDVSVCQQHFDELSDTYRIRSIKVYRMELAEEQAVPVLPCLDHEAMLHQRIPPHAAAYIENRTSHDLHEIVFIPESSLIEVDIISTDAEASQDSREQLRQELRQRFPTYRIKEKGLSYLRGDRRVMKACRAQVSLRDVLNGDDWRPQDFSFIAFSAGLPQRLESSGLARCNTLRLDSSVLSLFIMVSKQYT